MDMLRGINIDRGLSLSRDGRRNQHRLIQVIGGRAEEALSMKANVGIRSFEVEGKGEASDSCQGSELGGMDVVGRGWTRRAGKSSRGYPEGRHSLIEE